MPRPQRQMSSNPRRARARNRRRETPQRDPAQFVSQITTRVADFTKAQRFIDNRQIKISQWADYGAVTSTSTAAGFYSFSTVFTDIPDNANYSSSFDQYKVDSIEYHILPCTQAASPGTAPAYAFCFVYHDYDDVATPTSVSSARSYGNTVVLAPGERHIRKIRPHVATAATTSGAASIVGAKNEIASWIDTSSTGVPHYGLKIAVQQSNSTAINTWYVWARITCSLRNQK